MSGERVRQYVLVDTAKTLSGIEIPRQVHWFDGRCFEIDSVQYIKPIPKAQDGTTCFNVIINGIRTSIFKDYRGWYVFPKENITAESLEEMRKECVRRSIAGSGME